MELEPIGFNLETAAVIVRRSAIKLEKEVPWEDFIEELRLISKNLDAAASLLHSRQAREGT